MLRPRNYEGGGYEPNNADRRLPSPALHNRRPPRTTRIRWPRSRLFLTVSCVLLLLILALVWAIYPVLVLAFFKLRNHATDERWIGRCALRKRPLVFVTGPDTATAVWETSCEMEHLQFEWGPVHSARPNDKTFLTRTSAVVEHRWMPGDPTETHFVHQAFLHGLVAGGRFAYEVIDPQNGRILASDAFGWVTSSVAPIAAQNIPAVSTYHIAAVADNQYNVRVFQRLVRQIAKFSFTAHLTGRRSPTPSPLPPPHLLLHGGDAVQVAGSLQQWQTDFWDPLSTLRSTPILYARGNHDYDRTLAYAYTGGLPIKAAKGAWHALTIGRSRWIILDSNYHVPKDDEQLAWLRKELTSQAWTSASLRIVVCHVPPFIEYWQLLPWRRGEKFWSPQVRHYYALLWHLHNATLVISGHEHAYQRGKLPHAYAKAFTQGQQAAEIDRQALPAVDLISDYPGTIYTIMGGAGGTLDLERVEDWGIYEKSAIGKYHWVAMSMEFGATTPLRPVEKVYRYNTCETHRGQVDRLLWTATGLEGDVVDEFAIEVTTCDELTT